MTWNNPTRKLKTITKGYILALDGETNYIELGDLDITGSFSIEIIAEIMYFDTIYRTFLGKGWLNENYCLDTKYLNFRFFVRDNANNAFIVYSSTRPSLGKLYHLIGTYDEESLKIYVNGKQEAKTTIGAISLKQNDVPCSIGARWDGTKWVVHLKCKFILARLYRDVALTESEGLHNLRNPLNPVHKSDLVLWLDPTSVDVENNVWEDKSGYGNDGVINGAIPVFGYLYYNKTEDKLEFVRG
jgi:hypothetical protein